MSSGHIRITPEGFNRKPVKNKRIRKVEPVQPTTPPYQPPKKKEPSKLVLKFQAYKFILGLFFQLNKKDGNMLSWIKERLQEPSSYQGIIGILAAAGYSLNPEMLELIATTAVGLISLIQLGKKEKLVEKQDD